MVVTIVVCYLRFKGGASFLDRCLGTMNLSRKESVAMLRRFMTWREISVQMQSRDPDTASCAGEAQAHSLEMASAETQVLGHRAVNASTVSINQKSREVINPLLHGIPQ